ncbi:hypothetical protein [Aromatoleum diolicum]|uniref:Uncharacterized protein n=1 Tax=Aromatoleum diolicum TaxID=75796 RepID=A0ABX1QJS8_9RHOO|nr:hypothetical protein [Aromatoleum diolicum]NMG77575.1 hypothetical protein [Aromatoleum diolicum]
MSVIPASVSVSCCTTQRLQECADVDGLELIAYGRALVGETLARAITVAVLRTAIVRFALSGTRAPIATVCFPRSNSNSHFRRHRKAEVEQAAKRALGRTAASLGTRRQSSSWPHPHCTMLQVDIPYSQL